MELLDKIDVYFDGVNISENCSNPLVKGYTTNISFLNDAKIENYENFIKESLKHANGLPISFQLYDDDEENVEKTARRITSYGLNVFVKIPILRTDGSSNADVIKRLHSSGVKVNVTSIYTKRQLNLLMDCFGTETDVIISIFSGKIGDTGRNPAPVSIYARELFDGYSNVKILYAACRCVYNVVEAIDGHCDIITMPESVLNRLPRLGKDLEEMTLQTITQFRNDGLESGLTFD